MAKIIYSGPLNAAFLITEANGMYRSRDEADVKAPGTGLLPGTILGKTTATGIYERHTVGGAGGVQNPAGILFEGIGPSEDGLEQTVRRTVVVRDCEVHKTELVYSDGADDPAIKAADDKLRALGIIPRL